MIYLDHNSNAMIDCEVRDAMIEMLGENIPGNPSSLHTYGRKSKSLVEDARSALKEALGIARKDHRKYKAAFTASCTEANNIAISGSVGTLPITIPIEHHSVMTVVKDAIVPVNADGMVDLGALEEILIRRRRYDIDTLISVALANSSIGVVQDIKKISEIAHKYNAIVHTDAAQAFGKIPLDIQEIDADIVTLSSHKMGGPCGVGAIVFKDEVNIRAIMGGGKQEHRVRPGSHNVLAIHGFGLACTKVSSRVRAMNDAGNSESVIALRGWMEDEIMSYAPDAKIFSRGVERIPNTSSIFMPGVKGELQVAYFDSKNIAVSAGYSCASGVVKDPYIHIGLGFGKEIAECTLRVSLGLETVRSDIEAFLDAWKALYSRRS